MQRFTGKAGIYARFRPSYPEALLNYLYGEAGFTQASEIADIGAGTGIFSRLLLARGSKVCCVEPNDEMRAQLEASLRGIPNARVIAAPAEATTLPNAGVDFITAAQAFHWFDRAAFRAEARRILRPGGKVALVWNIQESTDPFIQALDALHVQFCEGYEGHRMHTVDEPETFDDFFAARCALRTCPNAYETDEQHFIGRCLSSSYAPREGDANHAAYVAALRDLFACYAPGGLLRVSNNTHCYLGEV